MCDLPVGRGLYQLFVYVYGVLPMPPQVLLMLSQPPTHSIYFLSFYFYFNQNGVFREYINCRAVQCNKHVALTPVVVHRGCGSDGRAVGKAEQSERSP